MVDISTRQLILTFRIEGNLCYLSHHETVSMLQRALIRAGVRLIYSQGFNPRPRLSLPLPRAVGVRSDCEMLCAGGGRRRHGRIDSAPIGGAASGGLHDSGDPADGYQGLVPAGGGDLSDFGIGPFGRSLDPAGHGAIARGSGRASAGGSAAYDRRIGAVADFGRRAVSVHDRTGFRLGELPLSDHAAGIGPDRGIDGRAQDRSGQGVGTGSQGVGGVGAEVRLFYFIKS